MIKFKKDDSYFYTGLMFCCIVLKINWFIINMLHSAKISDKQLHNIDDAAENELINSALLNKCSRH